MQPLKCVHRIENEEFEVCWMEVSTVSCYLSSQLAKLVKAAVDG